MNPLQQLYIQAIIQQQAQEKQVKQEEVIQKQNIQYLQKQQLLSLITQPAPAVSENKQTTLLEIQNTVTQLFQSMILRKHAITLSNYIDQQLPYFLKVIGNLIIYGLKSVHQESELIGQIIQQYTQQPLKISMSQSLFQTISMMFRQGLIYFDNGTQYLSKFLIFREEYSDIIFNTNFCYQVSNVQTVSQQLSFTQLVNLVKKSQEDVWTSMVYKVLAQGHQNLMKQQFLSQFNYYTNLINGYFKKQNLIMEVVESSVKETSQLHHDQIFQDYLLIMGSFKATTQDFLKKATQIFFEESNEDLDLILFSSNTQKLHKQTNTQILYVLPSLIQLEAQLLDYIASQQEQKPSKNSSNYYLKMIEKLKNKCVYNGEEACDCKKCQCIRRNRNSAKESQKKKREALEKIGPLQDSYETLHKKVKTIEDENETLRKLLIDVFKHPAVQEISSQFIEPLTKVIQDNDSMPHLSEC